jgi:hypothetical protein
MELTKCSEMSAFNIQRPGKYPEDNAPHLLITFLRLEFVVLVLYFYIYIYLCSFNYSLFFVVYLLVFSVCECHMGLANWLHVWMKIREERKVVALHVVLQKIVEDTIQNSLCIRCTSECGHCPMK